ncbi:hypothetical protein DB88DRAFT_464997 [Papiliotrema laurentii]|uniref:DNA replication factor Cdt1 C-terminal domain-containing protein n=1 Tax=Papiliotrema laurentii TaxID=5418 RepID=A0AAD9CY93_PAPLA|nr:hypothetical protein DB88DRAFT_464997 [Papiliotrema laurentii]
MSNVTPRKRKAAVMDPEPPARTPRARGKGAPAPNPPLVPFPTPPSSRHRHIKTPLSPSNVDLLPTHPIASSSTSATRRKPNGQPLPPHLQNLLSLHNAFNLALSLHMATHPPVLPSHPPTQTKLDLANLTNFLNIKETVERTGGRRFGLPELGRLAWVWSWDGEHLPGDKTVSQKNKGINEDDNPFLEPSETIATSSIRVCGMSYLITPTRTLDSSGRRVHTHGLGIELDLKPGETRQLVLSGYEDGMGDGGQGGGMGAVGRWSAGQEAREELFRRRLERWAELHGGYEAPEPSLLPTPSTSGSSRSNIPPIPILPLPHLGPASSSGNLFSSTLSRPDNGPGLSSLPKPKSLDDAFVLDENKDKGKIVRTGSVEERRQAMMDRIKARSGKAGPSLGSSVGAASLDRIRPKQAMLDQQEALKRRSTLSRLEGIAEAVWMMFSAPSPGPNSLPTAPTGRRKIIPLDEVAELVVKSSKTPISTAEAITSLKMLTEMCPSFLILKTVAKKEWLEMPTAVATAPASPGTAAASSRLMSAMDGSPRSGPTTPTRVVSAGTSGDMVGAGSPGRVRRVYGLREVRERIRRELGE